MRTENDLTHVRVFSHFYLNARLSSGISHDCWKVAYPSLATKTYGRALMVSGCITFKSLGSFILLNLQYAAPPIALIAGLVSFLLTVYKLRKKGVAWKEALKEAAVSFLKTSFKFFVVYMGWVIAMGVAVSLGIMAGPYLLLGLLFVGLITAFSLALATFIVEILPKYFQGKGLDLDLALKSFVRAFVEGFVWALIEHIDIAGLVAGPLGQVLDVLAVSVSVAFSYVFGGVIDSFFRHYKAYKKSKKEKPKNAKSLEGDIIGLTSKLSEQTLEGLNTLKEKKVKQKHLGDIIEKYIKVVVAMALLEEPTNCKDKEKLHDFIERRHDGAFAIFWCRKAKTRTLFEKAEKAQANNQAENFANAKKALHTRRDSIVKELNVYGIFTDSSSKAGANPAAATPTGEEQSQTLKKSANDPQIPQGKQAVVA